MIKPFLLFTAVAYFVATIYPKRTFKSEMPKIVEKIFMLTLGNILLINLHLNNAATWIIMAIFWTFASVMSYLGNPQWKLNYKEEPSDTAQMYMAAWDLLIALCCFKMAGI